MQYWQQFQQSAYFSEAMLVIGAVLLIVGVLQIVRSGIKMFFWLLISTVGIVSVYYGLQDSSYSLPSLDTVRNSNVSEIFSNSSSDVLNLLCEKLEKGG